MTDFIFKLKILVVLLSGSFKEWHREIWSKDLDQNYCCDGTNCCCDAITYREMWEEI
jgi:hypothetical protein